MHIVIITKNLPPVVCGIGDHSIMLAGALRSKGHQVTIVSGNGDMGPDRHVIQEFWLPENLATLRLKLAGLIPDHVILQYTPLMYADRFGWQNKVMVNFWGECSKQYRTSIILHETYFRVWWHLPSIVRGTLEKKTLQAMAANSRNVFTASQPLFDEVKSWPDCGKVCLLPIGANFVFQAIDRQKVRAEKGIAPDETVLTIFGGGELNLRKLRGHVNVTDALFVRNGIKAKWLLLGGVRKDLFALKSPVISPGFLSSEDMGKWLQLSDIFLMPQVQGLSAKRGTLMAALQHGLPVVGTRGEMTDDFWKTVPGVMLVSGRESFASAVLSLAKEPVHRQEMGRKNHEYHETFLTWDKIAGRFLGAVAW